MSNVVLMFIMLLVFVSTSMPIGLALGLSVLITLSTGSTINDIMIIQNIFSGLNSFTLLAIPFFMLAGYLMSLGGIAKRIVDFCDALLGWVTGGIGMVTVLACMFFAALSGSGPATVSAIGSSLIPEMVKRDYDKAFATGLTAVSGTIGVIIPPSIPFVVYGVAAGVSIGDLFIAGIIPGIIIGVFLMIVCFFMSKKRGYKGRERGEKRTFGQITVHLLKTFAHSFFALLAPVIILGGIYAGIFTPTEAAVVACVYSFIIGAFVYRELSLATFLEALKNTADVNGMTAMALSFSMGFAAFLAMEQVPAKLAAFILASFGSFVPVMLIIILILLVVGCFVDNISSCLILTPVFLPIVKSFGMSPVHFGIVLTVALAIGFVTPPYGVNLFVASAISDLKIEAVAKAALPFLAAMFIVLLLLAFIPGLSLSLVNLMKAMQG